jgi:hypothetical protein
MIINFTGGAELPNAYEAALANSEAGLIAVKHALGAPAVEAVMLAGALEDPDRRVAALCDVLYNELPLATAEANIPRWAVSADLPDKFRVFPTLEAPVAIRKGDTKTHFDDATAPNLIIYSPFAISIGTVGRGLFKGLRLPDRLTNDLILGLPSSNVLKIFKMLHTSNGKFNTRAEVTEGVQEPGDIILIPGSPRPSLHGVETPGDGTRRSVIGSYIATVNLCANPADLRRMWMNEKQEELQLMKACLSQVLRSRSSQNITYAHP